MPPPNIAGVDTVASSRQPRRIVVGLVVDVVGSFAESRLRVPRYDQPLEAACESYLVRAPLLFHQLRDIAVIHIQADAGAGARPDGDLALKLLAHRTSFQADQATSHGPKLSGWAAARTDRGFL